MSKQIPYQTQAKNRITYLEINDACVCPCNDASNILQHNTMLPLLALLFFHFTLRFTIISLTARFTNNLILPTFRNKMVEL